MAASDPIDSAPYLDYSIELWGTEVAWGVFCGHVRDAGGHIPFGKVAYWRVKAMFLNGDIRGYLTALRDCGGLSDAEIRKFLGRPDPARPARKAHVSRFVPGTHYHAMGEKFATFDAAEAHLKSIGVVCLGLRERHVYTSNSD